MSSKWSCRAWITLAGMRTVEHSDHHENTISTKQNLSRIYLPFHLYSTSKYSRNHISWCYTIQITSYDNLYSTHTIRHGIFMLLIRKVEYYVLNCHSIKIVKFYGVTFCSFQSDLRCLHLSFVEFKVGVNEIWF